MQLQLLLWKRPSKETDRRKKIISYKRPSRDYSKTKVKWSYELMKRLKSLWDEKRPEYNQLSEKYLREQASRIIKKNLDATNRQQSETRSRRTNNQNAEYNEGGILNQNEPNTSGRQDTQDNTEEINTSTQDNANDLNIDKKLYEVLKEKWDEYYEKYIDMIVQNRDYSTHISGQIADGQWEVIEFDSRSEFEKHK